MHVGLSSDPASRARVAASAAPIARPACQEAVYLSSPSAACSLPAKDSCAACDRGESGACISHAMSRPLPGGLPRTGGRPWRRERGNSFDCRGQTQRVAKCLAKIEALAKMEGCMGVIALSLQGLSKVVAGVRNHDPVADGSAEGKAFFVQRLCPSRTRRGRKPQGPGCSW